MKRVGRGDKRGREGGREGDRRMEGCYTYSNCIGTKKENLVSPMTSVTFMNLSCGPLHAGGNRKYKDGTGNADRK